MGPLVLAKNFTFALGSGQSFTGDWMGMDSQFQNGTIHVHLQTLDPTAGGGADVKVETSFDTVEANQIGTTITVSATGSQSAAISSNIASMVRLKIENQQGALLVGTISVWLQPKSD
jgi:hypothetical protein